MSEYRHPIRIKQIDDLNPYEKVETFEALTELLGGEEENVYAKIMSPMALAETEKIIIPEGKKLTLKLNSDLAVTKQGFIVQDGGELTIKGNGTITTKNKKPNGMVLSVVGKNAVATIDGVTIDCVKDNTDGYNEASAILVEQDGTLNFKSGKIIVDHGNCICTNNATGGATAINIYGGELYSQGAYAMYLPSQGQYNIMGGKVQGINARMGHFNIGGNAEIIPTVLNEENYDKIGDYINHTASVWLGDTISIMAGTYTDEDGTDTVINVKGNAKVKSDFRAAIGVYSIDTKQAQNVTVIVENKNNVTTTDECDAVKVYDHEYIAASAKESNKTYNPVAESIITIA